jgi:GNAT superfamily N-acetyltransferase
MANVLIRQAVSPDIDVLSRFEHCVKSDYVWQMNQSSQDGQISTTFFETRLPREMRLAYPRNPDTLEERWKNYSTVLVGCVDNAPIGYITLSAFITQDMVWVKDLVVDELWRRKGVGSALYFSARNWGMARKYHRITLELSSKNYPAICFSRKHGFEFTGFNDNYFNNNDIALFFSRLLK